MSRLPTSPLTGAVSGQLQLVPNNLLFEFANPDNLKPYPNNPHKHPKDQIEQVRASIRAYGLARAVVVDEESVIIDGEATWQAAKLEGKTSIPVLRLLGLSETEKRELRIGLNKHPLNADWDVEQLRIEIRVSTPE